MSILRQPEKQAKAAQLLACKGASELTTRLALRHGANKSIRQKTLTVRPSTFDVLSTLLFSTFDSNRRPRAQKIPGSNGRKAQRTPLYVGTVGRAVNVCETVPSKPPV